MQKSKNAFTMIELVFVIVILGVLAAVAIPEFVATRDDAKVSSMMSSIGTSIGEISSYATSQANVSSDLSVMSNSIASLVNTGNASLDTANRKATIKMDTVDCIDISIVSSSTNEDLNVSANSTGTGNALCQRLQTNLEMQAYDIRLRGSLVSD